MFLYVGVFCEKSDIMHPFDPPLPSGQGCSSSALADYVRCIALGSLHGQFLDVFVQSGVHESLRSVFSLDRLQEYLGWRERPARSFLRAALAFGLVQKKQGSNLYACDAGLCAAGVLEAKHRDRLKRRSFALLTANQMALFDHLREYMAREEIAALLGRKSRSLGFLLGPLVETGILEERDGSYRNTALAERLLVTSVEESQHYLLSHYLNMWPQIARMADSFCHDRVYRDLHAFESEKELRDYAFGMLVLGRPHYADFLKVVDLSGCKSVVDVGGGLGHFSAALLQRYPDLRCDLIETLEMLPLARDYLQLQGVLDRARLCERDLLGPFPGRYDAVLLANVVHFLSPDRLESLLQQSRAALPVGGQLVIKDYLLDADACGPPGNLMFDLIMFISTSAGRTYSISEICSLAEAQGLRRKVWHDSHPENRLLVFEKA